MFNSYEFWVMVIDVVVSLILYFVSKYAAPEIFEDVKFLIATVQPLVLAIVAWLTGKTIVRRIEVALKRYAR